MWTLFNYKNDNISEIFKSIDLIKKEVLSLLQSEVREYFSTKAVVYFDNNRLLDKKQGLHDNLLLALSDAEKEMVTEQRDFKLFPTVRYQWFHEDGKNVFAIDTTEESVIEIFKVFNFEIFKRNVRMFAHKEVDLQYYSTGGILFDLALVNFAKNWVDFVPNFEQRCQLQVEFILTKSLKSTGIKNVSRNEIYKHEKYAALLEKVQKVMPQIEREMIVNWEEAPKTMIKKINKKRISG